MRVHSSAAEADDFGDPPIIRREQPEYSCARLRSECCADKKSGEVLPGHFYDPCLGMVSAVGCRTPEH